MGQNIHRAPLFHDLLNNAPLLIIPIWYDEDNDDDDNDDEDKYVRSQLSRF